MTEGKLQFHLKILGVWGAQEGIEESEEEEEVSVVMGRHARGWEMWCDEFPLALGTGGWRHLAQD